MTSHSWIRKLFGRRQRGPIETRITTAARKSVKPTLEKLEDRVAPATVGYTGGELDITASAGEPITVTAPGSNQLQIQLIPGDTITLAGSASTNTNFTRSPDTSTLTIKNVNQTGGVNIGIFNVYLANQQAGPDKLTFGLGSNSGIAAVNIGANPNPATTQGPRIKPSLN